MRFFLSSLFLFFQTDAYGAACNMAEFSSSFQSAMNKTRASGDIVARTNKVYDPYARKWVKEDLTWSGEARQALREGRPDAAGTNYRLNAGAEAQRGNWAAADDSYAKAAKYYEQVNGGKLYSPKTDRRESFDLVHVLMERGDVSRAADFIDPKAYGDMGKKLQSTWLPDADAARIAQKDPIQGMNVYRSYYNSHRLRAEVYKRQHEKFGTDGALYAVREAENAAAAVKKTMEALARRLP